MKVPIVNIPSATKVGGGHDILLLKKPLSIVDRVTPPETASAVLNCNIGGSHRPAICSVVERHDTKKLKECTKTKVRIPHKPPNNNFSTIEN